MPDREKTINGLMCIAGDVIFCAHCKYSDVNGSGRGDRCKRDCAKDAIDLLKEHEKATIEPKRIDLADDTKAWLDKMDAVDVLRNIADICMDWDGYRTANGLGALINEIWAYARYCADRLQKAQAPKVMTLEEVDALGDDNIVWLECLYTFDGKKTATLKPAIYQSENSSPEEDGYYCVVSSWGQSGFYYKDNYMGDWRCWTSRPDQATREATPWN